MYELGQHVAYVLLPQDLPTDPDFEYHGIIIGINGNHIHVRLTDPYLAKTSSTHVCSQGWPMHPLVRSS
jgi:hypothetical protein